MPMQNPLASEIAAVLGTIDPDVYAHGAQNSDWLDLGLFDQAMAVLMTGDVPTTTSVDFKLQQATSSGGAGVKDITGKAITQILSGSPSSNDSQAVINCRADELDIDNSFRFVRAVATTADTNSPADSPVNTSDYSAVLVGFGARHEPASDHDLASVVEIVN